MRLYRGRPGGVSRLVQLGSQVLSSLHTATGIGGKCTRTEQPANVRIRTKYGSTTTVTGTRRGGRRGREPEKPRWRAGGSDEPGRGGRTVGATGPWGRPDDRVPRHLRAPGWRERDRRRPFVLGDRRRRSAMGRILLSPGGDVLVGVRTLLHLVASDTFRASVSALARPLGGRGGLTGE